MRTIPEPTRQVLQAKLATLQECRAHVVANKYNLPESIVLRMCEPYDREIAALVALVIAEVISMTRLSRCLALLSVLAPIALTVAFLLA